jgi:hypothetical protein
VCAGAPRGIRTDLESRFGFLATQRYFARLSLIRPVIRLHSGGQTSQQSADCRHVWSTYGQRNLD